MEAATEWLLENTPITKSECTTIRESVVDGDTGGYGVFVNFTKLRTLKGEKDSKFELLRIPRSATISMTSIRDILAKSTSENAVTASIKGHLTAFLSDENHHAFINETNLIVIYLVLKAILSDNKTYKLTGFASFYLNEVLLKTFVPLPCNTFQEDADKWNQYYKEYLNFPQQLFIEIINRFISARFLGMNYEKLISTVYCSVISRILEIPESSGEDTDDFFVSPTLVPLLDFVNHDNDHRNAHFDIDLRTNDIVLYLELDDIDSTVEEAQVFISYAPVEELVHFEQIYGFLPKSNNVQVWCYRFDEDFLSTYHYNGINVSHFYKCMRVRPSFQILILPSEVLINDCIVEFGELLILFSQHLQDPKKISFQLSETNDSYCSILKDKCGTETTKLLDKEECLEEFFGEHDEIENYEKTLKEFKSFLSKYITFRREKISSINLLSQNSSFTAFWQKEINLLDSLKGQFESKKEVMWYEKYGNDEKIKIPTVPFPPPSWIDYENMRV
ncbi:cytochrome c lysine N-methyltransferase [Kluyveromyces lactis]|uniref:Cytochrome c lysine N-methyltransferase 1 n=1 Tax=Kluyveromyces lactis (strain ATCC 8585 / CBS 2359 / DSM 70799 / NBRC 1267 / NRRL Y-1140 / WM37) TaxID=284590 RepID=CTM1_KLULA|nr:uncharacterized protein KLLA0_E21407g [Kluyveromyces lactis]Q6CMC0.1 RecName: Full=Cytochrome c lysine N-methyltransferase 1 [Kluyveromyces lactis NRRL Y-1140]CAH00006.1 KLLA0E21407p [Kluyveromyces lactis]|eukprot:XP_454919.1 uncharacterized protein KLLA0_E21407g [Kluyveromyces lactis]